MTDSDLPGFTPVPVRARRDGWTPERQREFIRLLRLGYRPGRAARLVGMSRKSAYALLRRPGAESFSRAWADAIDARGRRRAQARGGGDYERGMEGVPRPIRYRGRIVAVDRRCDDAAFRRLLVQACRFLEKRRRDGKTISPHGR